MLTTNIFGVPIQSFVLRLVNSFISIHIPEIKNGLTFLDNLIVCVEMLIFTLITNRVFSKKDWDHYNKYQNIYGGYQEPFTKIHGDDINEIQEEVRMERCIG